MKPNVNWKIKGTKIDDAAEALNSSVKLAINTKTLKKYESKFNRYFKENIQKHMRLSGVDAENFSDVFFLEIANGQINFVNTEPLITQRYEYGYYNNKDTNEEYYEGYMVETSPRYFIRPAIQDTLQEIGQEIINECNKQYMQNRRQTWE